MKSLLAIIFLPISSLIIRIKKYIRSSFQGVTILILLSFNITGCINQENNIKPVELSCEYLQNPNNIDISKPRLGWKLDPSSGELRNLKQSAYEIICASNLENLEKNIGDLWESGKVLSSSSRHIEYDGRKLASFEESFWKVRVWDTNGNPSHWSELATWKMAVMDNKYWDQADWIGMQKDTRTSDLKKRIRDRRRRGKDVVESHSSPLLRKEFGIYSEIESAFVYISGLGYNELFVNGTKVGDRVLEPGQTSYDVHSFYSVYEITDLLKKGDNSLGVMLGNGFYGQNMAFVDFLEYGKPRMKAFLRLVYSDVSELFISSDTSWKCTTGPIIFDNVYAGESYDARAEIPGWKRPGFNDSEWQNAILLDPPGGYLKSQLMPPIRKTGELKVKKIMQLDKNTWTLDFGQNISGWARIRVNEEAGTEIKLNYAEALFRRKNKINPASLGGFATGFGQEDIYICKGEGTEIWEPRFTYHGFRYIEISGLSSPPDEQTVTAILVHSDVDPAGAFECSDDHLNEMYEISKWTVLDNLHSIPEDCPHREKCGWLGDAHAVAEFSIFNFDMARFHTKYMADIHAVLGRGKTDGPNVPTMVAPGKRLGGEASLDWGVSIILVPYYLYLYYGDEKVFREYYEDMKTFVNHMLSFKNEEGYIENGLGDWCPPRWDRQNNPGAMECHPHISANAFFYKALDIMTLMAKKFDDPDYSRWAAKEAANIKKAFNDSFLVSTGDNFLWYGSQTATIMALEFEMVPDSIKEVVIEGLKYDIIEVNNTHHTTGIHGHRPYYSLLTDLGLDQLAYDVLTNPGFPSQAYIVNAGMTTWPERQWEWASDIEWDRSLNHPMQAGFAAFFHENVLGIKPDRKLPGFKRIIMKPHFTNQLKWAKGYHKGPYGKIYSSWKQNDDEFTWQISVPPNSEAIIYLPAKKINTIYEKGSLLENNKRLKILEKKDNYVVVNTGSGTYEFEIKR